MQLDIREIIEVTGFKLGHVAAEMGLKQSTFSMKLCGKRPFSSKEIESLSQVLEVNQKVLRRASLSSYWEDSTCV